MSAPIQVVDEHDQPIGQATKEEVWEKGLFHRCVRIMVVNPKGEVLLQHRSATKAIFPSTWDHAVGGHVDAGEDYGTAAYRELEEELGIASAQLKEIGRYQCSETWKDHRFNRFNAVYALQVNQTPTKLESGTIDEVRWWRLDDVKQLIKERPDQVADGLRQVIERYY